MGALCGWSLLVKLTVSRIFGSFTMETIFATAFGRVMDIQRGESDGLTEAVDALNLGRQEGKKTSVLYNMMLFGASKLRIFSPTFSQMLFSGNYF